MDISSSDPWGVPDSKPAPSDPQRAALVARHMDRGPLWVLELSGEADLSTRPILHKELGEAVEGTKDRLVVDVAQLRFCDVGCARIILETAGATDLSVVGASGGVERILALLDPLGSVPRLRTIDGETF